MFVDITMQFYMSIASHFVRTAKSSPCFFYEQSLVYFHPIQTWPPYFICIR